MATRDQPSGPSAEREGTASSAASVASSIVTAPAAQFASRWSVLLGVFLSTATGSTSEQVERLLDLVVDALRPNTPAPVP